MDYIAYTDGSYKEAGGIKLYASAAIVAKSGTTDWTSIVQCGSDPEYLSLRNVAGELFAVMQVCEYALNTLKLTPEDTLYINYDYVGIANWLRKPGDPEFWRCKKEVTKAYREYIYRYVKPRFKLVMKHVEGHSGNFGNEYVDKLAKDAIAKEIKRRLSEREDCGFNG